MAGQRKILIVEDDADSREALEKILKVQGWDTYAVATRHDAMAVLQSGFNPDFALLDLVLPDGDGGEVLSSMREAGSCARVIVMTAEPTRPGTSKLWINGIESIVAKPLDLTRLFFLLDSPHP